MNVTKLWLTAALAFFAASTVVRADTVYYGGAGVSGIASVTGTIVSETELELSVKTEDGKTISILQSDVYQVIRGTGSSEGHSLESMSLGNDVARPMRAPRAPRPYRYGLKGGMNLSNMNADPQELEEDDSLKSFALGGWWSLPLNRRLSVQAEALYSIKGDSEEVGGVTSSTRMTYIDVPVLARIGFRRGSPAQPTFLVGPSIALNISSTSKLESPSGDLEVDVKDLTRPIDLGVIVGGGVDFLFKERSYGVELRYSKGLSNAVTEDANGSAKNDVLALIGSVSL